MGDIAKISIAEQALLDPDRLVEICVKMGPEKADALISMSLDQLVAGVNELYGCFNAHNLDILAHQADLLARIADGIGMRSYARVSRDVAHCATAGQIIPLAATLGRLNRIAISSKNGKMDLDSMMR